MTRRIDEAVIAKAYQCALEARQHSHSPYSHYAVGAAVKSRTSERIFGGCNVENASYGASICAERSAILSLVSNEGLTTLDFVLVVTEDDPPEVPCAQCLQVMAEFATPDMPVYLANTTGIDRVLSFSELLPHPFTLRDEEQ